MKDLHHRLSTVDRTPGTPGVTVGFLPGGRLALPFRRSADQPG